MAGVGPQVVQVLDFATARAPELQALHEQASADGKLAAQRNQRRRRANAFKSHAMPRRLRLPVETAPTHAEEEHIALGTYRGGGARRSVAPESAATSASAVASAKAAKARAKRDQRRRCRKHRRRMHVLLEDHSWLKVADTDAEGAATVETPKWLATHAWHAKRMQMREAFGHVLAQRRQDKSVSAALSALRKTATLHDASYVGLLELYGLDTLILEALQLVTDPSGSDLDDAQLFSGAREGAAMLYQANQFPSGGIAPVRFAWRPLNGDDAEDDDQQDDSERAPRKRQLWLWIHAAAFMEAATAIASACQETMSEQDGAETIEILDRRGHLARLELRGKNANAMLDRVLVQTIARDPAGDDKAADASDHEDGFTRSEIVSATAHSNLACLRGELRGSASSKRSQEVNREQGSVFTVRVQDPRLRTQSSQSTTTPASGRVPVSLLNEPVIDTAASIVCPLSGLSLAPSDAEEPDSARILAQLEALLLWTTTPGKTSEPSNEATYPYPAPTQPPIEKMPHGSTDVAMADAEEAAAPVPCSELWSLAGRDGVRRAFLKDHALNRLKQQAGTMCELGVADVPVMLVRQPGAFPHTGGWDVILTPAYAPAFLNALVFSGAMVIGLDEHEALATVAHAPSFPRDFPDSASGRAYWDQLGDAQENEYAKKPKAKRVAYDKLGVDSPFQPNWDLLFGELAAEGDADQVDDEDEDEDDEMSPSMCVLRSASYMEPFPFSRALADDQDDEPMELVPVAVPTLIRVALSFPRRAALEPCSMLYIPTEEDLASFHADAKWSGRECERDSELELLGFVTSAVYDRPMSAFRGTAFCACDALQRLALVQLQRRDQKTTHFLALTRTPSSRQLRPVALHIQA